MDQENAKKFITGNHQDKYQFFKDATDLDRIAEAVKKSREQTKASYNTMKQYHKQLAEQQQAVKEYEKQIEDLKSLDTFEADLKKWNITFAFAICRDFNRGAAQKKKAATAAMEEIKKLQTKFEEARDKYAEIESSNEQDGNRVQELDEYSSRASGKENQMPIIRWCTISACSFICHRSISYHKGPLVLMVICSFSFFFPKRRCKIRKRRSGNCRSRLSSVSGSSNLARRRSPRPNKHR